MIGLVRPLGSSEEYIGLDVDAVCGEPSGLNYVFVLKQNSPWKGTKYQETQQVYNLNKTYQLVVPSSTLRGNGDLTPVLEYKLRSIVLLV